MNNPKVLVIGGGLPALYAYYGARAAGYSYRDVEVRASEIIQPQDVYYLDAIPGMNMNSRSEFVKITLSGTPDQYMINTWGAAYPSNLGRYQITQTEYAHDPALWFDLLWQGVNFKYDKPAYTPRRIEDLSTRFEYIIQTIGNSDHHMSLLNRYLFPLWVGKYDRGRVTENGVFYNGDDNPTRLYYLKVSILFGKMSVLFPKNYRPPNLGKALIDQFKDMGVTGIGRFIGYPDLHPDQPAPTNRVLGAKDNVLLTGRWAALDRLARPVDSYNETLQFLTKGSTNAN